MRFPLQVRFLLFTIGVSTCIKLELTLLDTYHLQQKQSISFIFFATTLVRRKKIAVAKLTLEYIGRKKGERRQINESYIR
jgi:hypothetical protein